MLRRLVPNHARQFTSSMPLLGAEIRVVNSEQSSTAADFGPQHQHLWPFTSSLDGDQATGPSRLLRWVSAIAPAAPMSLAMAVMRLRRALMNIWALSGETRLIFDGVTPPVPSMPQLVTHEISRPALIRPGSVALGGPLSASDLLPLNAAHLQILLA